MKFSQVVFEGPNRAGKTSAKTAFEKLTNFKYVTIDRSIITNIVYNRLFNRPDYKFDLSQYRDIIFVYCYAPIDIIRQRYIETNHPPFQMKEEIVLYSQVAHEFVKDGFHIVFFDTSIQTSEEIAEKIVKYIDNLEENYLHL